MPAADVTSLVTSDDVARDLRDLGLRRGDVVLCHVRLSEVGWLPGAHIAFLAALFAVVGPGGLVVAPAFTTYLTDPSSWRRTVVPPVLHDDVRAALPAFDPDLHEPQAGLGGLPRSLLRHRGCVRSHHPVYSFAARGDGAAALTADVDLDFALGCRGVPGRLVDRGVRVLTVGLPWWRRFTLFHLAESIAPYRGRRTEDVAVRVGDHWRATTQLVIHDGDFESLAGADAVIATGQVGAADATLVDGEAAVAHAVRRLLARRNLDAVDWTAHPNTTRPAPARAL